MQNNHQYQKYELRLNELLKWVEKQNDDVKDDVTFGFRVFRPEV